MINVNRHTDFSLIFTFTNEAGSIVPIPDNVKIDFYTNGYQMYTISKMGDVMTNCAIVDGQFITFLDNHNLPCGQLKAKVINIITNEFFPDGKESTQKPISLDYTLIEGAGDTPTQASVIKLPSYQKGDRGFSAAEVLVNAGIISSVDEYPAFIKAEALSAASIANEKGDYAFNNGNNAQKATTTANDVASELQKALTNANMIMMQLGNYRGEMDDVKKRLTDLESK